MAISRTALVVFAVVAVAGFGSWLAYDILRPPDTDVTPATEVRDLAAMSGDRDVRLAYRMPLGPGWESVERVDLAISRLEVDYIASERGCHDPSYLAYFSKEKAAAVAPKKAPARPVLQPASRLPLPDSVVYRRDYASKSLTLRPNAGLLDLADLNRLPNGFIVGLRLFVDGAELVRDLDGTAETVTLDVPESLRTEGLTLAASDGPVPVCERFITSIRFEHDDTWLVGDIANPALLGDLADAKDEPARLVGEATAPEAVFPNSGGRLEVPEGLWVEVPRDAVTEPMLIRVREMDWLGEPRKGEFPGDDVPIYELPEKYQSADFIFRKMMRRIGLTYELKPDGFMFERPVEMALPLPMRHAIHEETLDWVESGQFPPELAACLRILNSRHVSRSELAAGVSSCVRNKLSPEHALYEDLLEQLPKKIHEVPLHDPESTAMFTWSPAYRLWLPDVPRLLPAHQRLVTEELDRVIAAEEATEQAGTHERIDPDFSAIPEQAYQGLELDRINKHLKEDYLVTVSNHFCIKSLFADLNVEYVTHPVTGDPVPDANYEPLLEGALDDMCQTTDGFGFPRDSNEDVHCGGDPASGNDMDRRARKTARIIQREGVALRFRNNVRTFFENHYEAIPDCPASAGPDYCYDLDDFVDDVNWAFNVWQQALNRDPDGGWTDRFTINCTEFEDDDDNCSGREFDVGIRDIRKENVVGRSYGRNFTIDEVLLIDPVDFDGAIQNREGRARLRSTLLHELGHSLGLDHWAGAGALMSYNGRWRRNDLRYNLCAPFSVAEVDGTNYPTAVSDRFCEDPATGGRFGTTNEPDASGAPDYHSARVNRLTCTDIQRIRQQVNAAETWTTTEPIRCEIMAEQTEYAAVERREHDASAQEAYTVLELDLRFRHCGDDATEFDRVELELLGVDAGNDSNVVTNLYRDDANPPGFIYSVSLGSRDADGFYEASLTLDSRQLLEPVTQTHTHAVTNDVTTVYPSFKEYMAGANLAGLDAAGNAVALSYESLAMVLRTFVEIPGGGDFSEFVAGSTGLLRSPILMPVDAPLTVSLAGLELDGVALADDLPSTIREDFATAEDLFPHIDDSRQKPNVGRVLYLILPPRADAGTQRVAADFEWQIPDQQYSSWEEEPKLLWVHSVEVARGDVPTIEDWELIAQDWPAGTLPPLNSTSVSVTDNPAIGSPVGDPSRDPCRYLSDDFELDGLLAADPLSAITSPADNPVNAWDLFQVRINYEYVPIRGCNNPSQVCVGGALGPGCNPPGPPNPDRSQDFYVSLSGPTGSIVEPNESSLCIYNICRTVENSYSLGASLKGMSRLEDWFDDRVFQVRFFARGDVIEAGVDADPEEDGWQHEESSDWVRVAAIGTDDYLAESLEWYNNSNDHAYQVQLQYRHCQPSASDPDCTDDASWSAPQTLDTLRLRFDERNSSCAGDDFAYQNTIDRGCVRPDD